MITIYVPTSEAVKALATVVGYLTDGLDAALIEQRDHEEGKALKFAGNDRDLGTVVERAHTIGGSLL